MHPFFRPLSSADLGLLVTALSRGDGARQVALFAHLPPERGRLLSDKAQALLQIAADTRVALMVRELKAQLAAQQPHGLERMDPSWLARALKEEPPHLVGLVLLHLPTPLVRSILRRLPAPMVQSLPPKEQLQKAPPALAQMLLRMLEGRFVRMPPAPSGGSWDLFDLVHLERRDLNTVVHDLGLLELGQAFAAVGRMALLDLCRRLPRASAEALVEAVSSAAEGDAPDLGAAKFFLSEVVVNFDHTEQFIQRAGLWRLAKATCSAPPQRLQPLLQRLPTRAAALIGELQHKVPPSADAATAQAQAARWQDSILARVVVLGQAGRVHMPCRPEQLAFADPAALQRALSAAGGKAPRA